MAAKQQPHLYIKLTSDAKRAKLQASEPTHAISALVPAHNLTVLQEGQSEPRGSGVEMVDDATLVFLEVGSLVDARKEMDKLDAQRVSLCGCVGTPGGNRGSGGVCDGKQGMPRGACACGCA